MDPRDQLARRAQQTRRVHHHRPAGHGVAGHHIGKGQRPGRQRRAIDRRSRRQRRGQRQGPHDQGSRGIARGGEAVGGCRRSGKSGDNLAIGSDVESGGQRDRRAAHGSQSHGGGDITDVAERNPGQGGGPQGGEGAIGRVGVSDGPGNGRHRRRTNPYEGTCGRQFDQRCQEGIVDAVVPPPNPLVKPMTPPVLSSLVVLPTPPADVARPLVWVSQ